MDKDVNGHEDSNHDVDADEHTKFNRYRYNIIKYADDNEDMDRNEHADSNADNDADSNVNCKFNVYDN